MTKFLWWTGQCLLVLVALFFLVFGISLFIGAYKLDNPFYFIMTVFGSNLMILISAVLLIGFILRMVNVFKLLKNDQLGVDKEKEDKPNKDIT